ncbi:MAG: hypothetical protein VYB88_00935 [Pseudomonadota bacterium]|nr:hypothetical protein [Pseudomonadota bacterium]
MRLYATKIIGNKRKRTNADKIKSNGHAAQNRAESQFVAGIARPPNRQGPTMTITSPTIGSVISHSSVTSQPRTPYSRCARARAADIAIQLPCMNFLFNEAEGFGMLSGQFFFSIVSLQKNPRPPPQRGPSPDSINAPRNPTGTRLCCQINFF